ncbi:MAG: glycoside hydrolase family 57 protein [Nitrospirota bacterium]|nr:glycoside hydrolase family 57 protein [Nitrospirota bacterium]
MSPPPLHLAVVWHMHQPHYKDLVTGRYVLPWTRLHGTKDYYDMVKVLEQYPRVRQTVNVVPSLAQQIIEYAEGKAEDEYQNLTLKNPAELTVDDKVRLLTTFFYAAHDTMVRPHARYSDLLTKRGAGDDPHHLARVASYFTDQDFVDLQVWFNLAWCDPLFHRTDPVIRALLEKGRDYSAEDKHALVERHQVIMGMILPEYRAAQERGQVELTTTPFYHPILPLLCDTEVAREAMPHHPLPGRFVHPEDAAEQIRRAVAFHTDTFGRAPRGMWPSEGSVSEAILPLVAGAGIQWIATDQGILAESHTREPTTAGDHFRPYLLERDGGTRLSIVFRDQRLSDRIGFHYARMEPEAAAEDFITSLHRIRAGVDGNGRPPLVSVILDGENCWEYYSGDGHDFLNALYRRLSDDPDIVCTTVSDHLDGHPASDRLPRLFAGSWINRDFEIWIGRDEDNQAWEHLGAAREALAACTNNPGHGVPADKLALAWEELYVAEGSDWCWWYGGQHAGMLVAFDQLFRRHLMNIYELIGQPVPEALHVPILRQVKEATPTRREAALITPTIDGRVESYFEWLAAGLLEQGGGGGAMHAGDRAIVAVHYGFDHDHLYLRLDFGPDVRPEWVRTLNFTVGVLAPVEGRVTFRPGPEGCIATLQRPTGDGEWSDSPFEGCCAFAEVLEIAMPFAPMGWKPGDEVRLFVRVLEDGAELERWPGQGYLAVTLPDRDYEAHHWVV